MTISRWHKKIYDAQTNKETIIEYTAEEIEIAEANEAVFLAELKKQQEAQVIKDKQKAALLIKLGITAEEAALLLS
jgi:hypothetical protein